MALRDGSEQKAAQRFAEALDCAGEIRTERWYALCVELHARVGTDDADRLTAVGRALREVGADSVCARALGDYALVSAAARGAPDQGTVASRAERIEANLPPRYRWRLWHEVARLRDRQADPDAAAAARDRSEQALALIRSNA